MRSFINKYGIRIHEMSFSIHNAFIYSEKIYFVKNKDAEPFYENVSNVAIIEEILFIKDLYTFSSMLELQMLCDRLPIEDDKILGMDIVDYDIIIPDMDHTIVYDGLSKQDVFLPKDFLEESVEETKYFQSPILDLPPILMN